MSWNWLFAAALSSIVCFGQGFSNLRATNEGTLFFLTQTQPMGAGLDAAARVWVKDVAGIRQFPGSEGVSGFEVSSDGGVVVLYRGGESIVSNGSGAEYLRLRGVAKVSPNGKYLGVDDGESVTLLDVASKQPLGKAPGMRMVDGRPVASSGVVAMLDEARRIRILRGDAETAVDIPGLPLQTPVAQIQLYLDDAGRSLVAMYGGLLVAKVLGTPASVSLQLPLRDVQKVLRFDGLAVDCLRSGGIFRVPLDGRPMEFLATRGLVRDATAVNADRFFYDSGDTLQDVRSGSEPIEVARIGAFSEVVGEALPGSVFDWSFPSYPGWTPMAATSPYPYELGGYKVLVNGKPAPIVALANGMPISRGTIAAVVRFVVPWSLTLTGDITPVELALIAPQGTIFNFSPVRLYLRRQAPRFERGTQVSNVTTDAMLRVLRENGSQVNTASPALPNELVTASLRGLGLPASMPPDDRLPTERIGIAGRLDCLISDGGESRVLPLESVTLSTRQLGLYDVTFRIPAMRPRGELFVGCEMNGGGDSISLPARRPE